MLPCIYTITTTTINFNLLHHVDCTYVRINRVHPFQYQWYRTDLGYHTFTIQLLVDSLKNIKSAIVGKGHNNDSGMAMITGLNEFVTEFKKKNNFQVLGDSVYGSDIFTTPTSINPSLGEGEELMENKEKEACKSIFKKMQASKRSVVETEFADMKNRYGTISTRGIYDQYFLSYCTILVFHIEQLNKELK
ncbi:hypothetical protein ACTFIY_011062 [Dictyostelium cf. discoideum]